LKKALGVNPYKFGMVAATDTHNTGSPMEEDRYFGKLAPEDGTPEVRLLGEADPAACRSDDSHLGILWSGGGVGRRKYPRSHLRCHRSQGDPLPLPAPAFEVRLFGGWDFTQMDAN
jgi:hypothetical protein